MDFSWLRIVLLLFAALTLQSTDGRIEKQHNGKFKLFGHRQRSVAKHKDAKAEGHAISTDMLNRFRALKTATTTTTCPPHVTETVVSPTPARVVSVPVPVAVPVAPAHPTGTPDTPPTRLRSHVYARRAPQWSGRQLSQSQKERITRERQQTLQRRRAAARRRRIQKQKQQRLRKKAAKRQKRLRAKQTQYRKRKRIQKPKQKNGAFRKRRKEAARRPSQRKREMEKKQRASQRRPQRLDDL